jgi:hypothetical protein
LPGFFFGKSLAMELENAQRERAAFDLAERLFFKLERTGDRYSLRREVGEFAPRTGLSLEEVEQLLERWKLQGPHGG